MLDNGFKFPGALGRMLFLANFRVADHSDKANFPQADFMAAMTACDDRFIEHCRKLGA